MELVSDLHLEFIYGSLKNPKEYLQKMFDRPASETLLIAGDISSHLAEPNLGIIQFFDLVLKKYKRVIAVLGNHDYINDFSTIEQVPGAAKELFPEVTWLNNEGINFGEVRIFGSTLWSQISQKNKSRMTNYMIDYHKIEKQGGSLLTPDDTNKLNTEAFDALQKCIGTNSIKPVIVLSHHGPSLKSSKIPESETTEGFCNNYDDFLKQQGSIKLWLHGHVHEPVDYKCGKVRIVTNPHGYVDFERKADSGYKPKVLRVRS